MLIFKIVPPEEWKVAQQERIYHGSAHDKADGFLHFSTAPQLAETLRRYYSHVPHVVIIAVDAAKLGDALKYEYSASRNEDFPHLYGSLDLIYEPAEKATIMSELFTFPSHTDSIQRWLDELSTS